MKIVCFLLLVVLVMQTTSCTKNENTVEISRIDSTNNSNVLSCHVIIGHPVSFGNYILNINNEKYMMLPHDSVIHAVWLNDYKLRIVCSKEPIEYYRGFGKFEIMIEKNSNFRFINSDTLIVRLN